MQRHRRILRILLGPLLLASLVWAARAPHPAPAAANSTITPLFLGSLSGGTTTNPGPADQLFTTLAGSAIASIDVAMYDFGRASVRDALIAGQGRGVDVRIVAESDAVEDPIDGPFYSSLVSAGIPVISDTLSSLQHNKFAIFDSAVTWTGSANWSDSDFTRNGNNVLVITDTVVASIYATEFEEMFGGAFSNSKTDNTAHSTLVGGSQVEIAFSPTDSIESRIVDALGTADASIQVAMFTFTNDAIGDALIAARGRGVQVEVLLDGLAAGGLGGERDRLCAAGITVRVENWSGLLHDKYAVVDTNTASDPLIITGSTNWTANAVESNDENLLIVHDGGLAAAYAADIARMRSAIAPGGFVCNPTSQATATPTPTRTPTATATATAATTPIGDPICVLLPGRCVYLPLVRRASAPALTPTPTQALAPTATPTRTATSTPSPTATPTRTPSATPTATTTPSGSAAITFIRFDPPDTLSEYVEIQHTGGAALDMTGWTLSDLAGNTYTFPSFTLAPGATVRVWTNSGTNNNANLYWGRGSAVWNNGGDTAFLRDAQGTLIDQYSY